MNLFGKKNDKTPNQEKTPQEELASNTKQFDSMEFPKNQKNDLTKWVNDNSIEIVSIIYNGGSYIVFFYQNK
jgi:hypothetical protein